jgi:hypothetical protein
VQVYRILYLALALIFVGVGCHSTINQTGDEAGSGNAPLQAGSRVYVALPPDAIDKKVAVMGSGGRTASAVSDAFKRHTRNVVRGKMPETLEEALAHARELQYEYVAYPVILKWQDRATEWSGVRDKLQLKIDLVEVNTGAVLRSTMIDGKGRWMTEGEDTPQDMLGEPVEKFVRSLFRLSYTPSALQ